MNLSVRRLSLTQLPIVIMASKVLISRLRCLMTGLRLTAPGTFAGMVRKENIRYTHFSRNPKIAAFLKDYGYVKEYGEGVDRMCKELEAAGLPDPVFDNNTFILKTTIMSSAYEKLPIEDIKPADLGEKSAVNVGKVADSAQTANNHTERLPIKMPFEIFVKRYEEHAYNEPTIISLQQIYEGIDVNQIFGSAYLVKILECSDRTARNLMAKLREMDVIVPVTGKGKGMYRFKYDNE